MPPISERTTRIPIAIPALVAPERIGLGALMGAMLVILPVPVDAETVPFTTRKNALEYALLPDESSI